MICSFCGKVIHFYEEFYAVKSRFFHIQIITETSVRCKRVKLLPKLVAAEKRGGKK